MTVVYCMIPIVLQGVLMVVDEGWFHRRRGLPRWERLGHPLDTLTIAVCLAWLVATDPGAPAALPVYIGLAGFSTVFITKDELLHVKLCSRGEHWLHAILFVVHPIALAAFGYLWWIGAIGLVVGQLGITIAYLAYQVIYWNLDRDLRDLCDGSLDGQVLVDEVRARPVRDRRPRARQARAVDRGA